MLVFTIKRDDKTDKARHNTFDRNVDLLAYTLFNHDAEVASLMLYDPLNRVSTPILTDIDFRDFSFSVDDRLAFSSTREGTAQIYVIDTLAAKSTPTNISRDPATNDYPLAWSPDGNYLAFTSYKETNSKQIYVWDGEHAIDITPDDMYDIAENYDVSWSSDGRLAFTIRYGYSFVDHPSEIYLWDGHTTMNLSQNPTGEDRNPTWSADGQVAFLSEGDDGYDILVWDGVSIRRGSPDRGKFTNVSTTLTGYYSYPTWTNTGLLAFTATPPQERHVQVFVWDGRTATNISQNPSLHNSSPRWSNNGNWAFVTFFSRQQLLYVRNAENDPLISVEGQYSPAWSQSEELVFCQPRWVLSLWDGQQIIELAEGDEIWAEWQSGPSVACSSG